MEASIWVGKLRIFDELAVSQALQKLLEICALDLRQREGADTGVLQRILVTAAYIMIQHRVKRRQTSVVHVRRRECHIAQGGNLELAHVGGAMRDLNQPAIVRRVSTVPVEIVKARIGEQRRRERMAVVDNRSSEVDPRVALTTADSRRIKKRHAALGRRRQSGLVIVKDVAVER